MHLFISAEDSAEFLLAELRRRWPSARHDPVGPRLIASEASWDPGTSPALVFARQCLPEARSAAAPSISAWAELVFQSVVAGLPEDQPWRLQVEPVYAEGEVSAGRNRCRLIVEALRERLSRKRRRLLRQLRPNPGPLGVPAQELEPTVRAAARFSADESLVQVILTGAESGHVSILRAPGPAERGSLVSPFPLGEIPIAVDKAAPSRAFAKLVEAEWRLGRWIGAGDVCVDLGASPGSWTYVAAHRGARVIAVDRSPLREDLMRHPGVQFQQGDAFKFAPKQPVDWLVCDVIAAPERSIDLVLEWARRRWARQFVVTIKFKGTEDYPQLDRLIGALPEVSDDWRLTRLCANKNEACALGTVRAAPGMG